MSLTFRLASSVFAALLLPSLLSVPVHAEEAGPEITLPAFSPTPGTTYHYRTRITMEVSMVPVATLPNGLPATTSYGDFLRDVEYLRKDDGTYEEIWHLSAEVPADASDDPTKTYLANQIMAESLKVYGIDRLRLQADQSGIAMQMSDVEVIKANLARAEAALNIAPAFKKSTLQARLNAMIEADPMTIATVLIPELTPLQESQSASAGSYKVGTVWPIDWADTSGAVAIRHTGQGRIEAADAAAATVTMDWTSTATPPESVVSLVESKLAGSAPLTDTERKALEGYSETSHNRQVFSLTTGMAREMTAEITTKTAQGQMRVTFRTTCTNC